MPRGYDNNNPGNIRLTSGYWLGEVSGSDPDFKTFKSMEWGYRAMFVLLKSYLDRGYNTITKILNRYAPPSENDTQAYIDHVVRLTGFSPHQVLQHEPSVMKKLVAAISTHENGISPNWTQIESGWELTGDVQVAKTVGISLTAVVVVTSIAFVVFQLLKQKK